MPNDSDMNQPAEMAICEDAADRVKYVKYVDENRIYSVHYHKKLGSGSRTWFIPMDILISHVDDGSWGILLILMNVIAVQDVIDDVSK